MREEKHEGVTPWRIAIGGCAALAGSMGIGRFIYTPILPQMAEALHLSKSDAGLIASANFAGYLCGALGAAMPFLKRKRRWMIISLLASALTTGAMGIDAGLPLFLAMRFVGGLASAFVFVLSTALVLEHLTESGDGKLAPVHFAGVGAGILISAAITWFVMLDDADWRWMWFGGAVVCLLTFFVAVLIPDSSEQPPGVAGDNRVRVTRAWPLVLAYGLLGFGYVITATFIVTMVRGFPDARNLEPLVWGVVGIFAIPSVACWSRIAKEIGILRAFAVAGVIQAAGVGFSVFTTSVAGLLISAALLGCTFMGMTSLGMMAARIMSPQFPQRFMAVMTAAFGLGQMIGPSAAGYAFEWTGSFDAASLAAVFALLVAAVLVTLLSEPATLPHLRTASLRKELR